jgi:hypothetical protein
MTRLDFQVIHVDLTRLEVTLSRVLISKFQSSYVGIIGRFLPMLSALTRVNSDLYVCGLY